MTRRRRFVPGMLMLAALTFSLAESVVASTCVPMQVMGGSVRAVETGAMAHDCAPDAGSTHADDPGDRNPFHCPFGPMTAAQGCTAAASLPAPSAGVGEIGSGVVASTPFDDPEHDLLLAAPPFHPPKA
jgi:hypothetical protein